MKDLLRLLKRFVPPYKKSLFLNILFNILGTAFGIFQFGALIPILGILFETDMTKAVTELPVGDFSIEYLKDFLYYHIWLSISTNGKAFTLLMIGAIMVIAVIFKVGFTYLASYNMVTIRNGVVRDIRNQIFEKILYLPLPFFSEERKGDIIARMTSDVQEIEGSIMNSLEAFFKNPILIIGNITVMVIMSWQLTIFVFILLPISGYFIGKVGKSLKKRSNKGQNKLGEILSTIEETLGGLRIVKAFNAEAKMHSRLAKENESYRVIMNGLMRRRFLAHPMSEFLGTVVIVIILWYGGTLVLSGETNLTAEVFIAYLTLFYSIINPAKAFSTALYSVQKGLASIERVDMILLAESTIKEKENPVRINQFNNKIEYKNISFKYDKDYVLEDVNVTVEKGKTIALVGQSGSGKTTFVDLLPRFHDVNKGAITIDGKDIKDLKSSDLRDLMGNVNQESILFNDTFFNNIAFGVEGATKEDVINAAKIANAHEFIMSTENGYDTNIGDRGGKLSGGQRQRISIARAVLKNPPIMILDEATSALDTESERLVQDALDNLMKNRTSIVIAHRLSTIRKADEICVFNKGKIVERGKHDELLALNGYYKKLHNMQMF